MIRTAIGLMLACAVLVFGCRDDEAQRSGSPTTPVATREAAVTPVTERSSSPTPPPTSTSVPSAATTPMPTATSPAPSHESSGGPSESIGVTERVTITIIDP